ncbi:DUF354 domain-containing protein [Desulfobacula sp.]|uniref:DUF354 domain-containing protein n=1 Tax=Desulfobacula sp. TaxID=2593537 RepID=UPI0025C6190E|nr:DUF354 domain-containing protein [Desulfobacula sp.]MBC2704223.1 DUF354 domain-containing protein [Desulfobacula sp.]
MNILVLTGHPAQVHNFKLVKNELEKNGHNVFWIATEKDISRYLLNQYNISYLPLEKPGKKMFSKIYYLIKNTFICLQFIRKEKIDIIVSRVSPYAALAGFLLRKPHFALADTESSGIYDTIFTKLVTSFLTAKSFQRTLRKDQIRFNGNIELFYLHPNRFQPDKNIVRLLGIENDEPYVVMRFVSWDAYHDKGLSGFIDANKIKAVKAFSKYARIFISAEKDLPPELEPYKIQIPPEKMHDVLAHAALFFGESATMASESAVLGTPGIFLDKIGRGYTDEEEVYGLVFNFNNSMSDQENAIEKGVELLARTDTKEVMKKNREIFLKDKIDVTAFLVWFIENYPDSFSIMKENPEYQNQFN